MKVGGERMFLWLAIDDEGEVPDMLVQERRNKGAALRLLRKLLRNQGGRPEAIMTDKLPSYRAAARDLGLAEGHRPGGMRQNNRAVTHTCRSGAGSESSRSSSPELRPRNSWPPMLPSTMCSTSSPI